MEEALSLRRAPLTWRKGRRWGLKIPSFKRVPVQVRQWVKIHPPGLEPGTNGSEIRDSIQLS